MATLDFESDQQVLDNLEAVTYTSVATLGNTPYTVPDAGFYRYQGLQEGAPSQGVYVKQFGRFSIRPLALPSGVKPADTITRADGSVWTVLRAVTPSLSVFQIDVINLSLSFGLQQIGNLLRPPTTKDQAGRQALGPYSGYSTIASNVPCRVQPVTGDSKDEFDRKTIEQKFTGFVTTQLTPAAKDVFNVGTAYYAVLDFRNPQRIDELQTLSLELIT